MGGRAASVTQRPNKMPYAAELSKRDGLHLSWLGGTGSEWWRRARSTASHRAIAIDAGGDVRLV